MTDKTPTPGLTREQKIQGRLDAIAPHQEPTVGVADDIMHFRQHSVADMTYLLDSNAQLANALATVRAATDNHPDPCGEHPDGDAITCGWKHAYADVCHALATVDSRCPWLRRTRSRPTCWPRSPDSQTSSKPGDTVPAYG